MFQGTMHTLYLHSRDWVTGPHGRGGARGAGLHVGHSHHLVVPPEGVVMVDGGVGVVPLPPGGQGETLERRRERGGGLGGGAGLLEDGHGLGPSATHQQFRIRNSN